MKRSKRSSGYDSSGYDLNVYEKLNSIAHTILRSVITLFIFTLISACNDNRSPVPDDTGSTIIVGPASPPDNAASPTTQNNLITSAITEPSNTAQNDDAANLHTLNSETTTPTESTSNEPLVIEPITPNVVGGLPPDCLFDVSANGVTFCYQAQTRTLRAWQRDGQAWWGYDLPGDNATNNIHALQVVNESLYILAELKAEGIQTGFEVSKFALGGAFKKTVALPKFQDYSFVSGERIQVDDIGDNLIITGDYGLSANNILPNQFNGTFVAVFNTATDQIDRSILYPQLRQTNPMLINGELIRIELEHVAYEISPSNLTLAEAIGRFQSIPFHRSNYHQKKSGLIGFIEKPPFEELHEQMNEAYLQTLRNVQQVDPNALSDAPLMCTGGGTVQQNLVVDEFDSEVRTTTFENCVMEKFSANGILLQRTTRTCGDNCEGLNKTLRALGFNVTYVNGEKWSVDGYISIKETRNTHNPITGESIKNPEARYTNLTEFSVFNMSDDQISIDLTQGQYQYDGTLKSGTGTWVGSGSLTFASGIVETFAVDISRQLLNGVQVDFNGQLDANRSDGTALYITADAVDLASVRFTTTADGESIQAIDSW